MTETKSLLLIIDPANFEYIKNNSVLRLKFSHDLNILQIAASAILEGYIVYATYGGANFDSPSNFLICDSIFPVVKIKSFDKHIKKLNPSLILSAGPDTLTLKERFPRSKLIAYLAAMHFIESPGLHDAKWIYNQSIAIRLHVDFILTQNLRMAEIATIFFKLVSAVDFSSRIFPVPLGVFNSLTIEEIDQARMQTREKYGLENKIVIGNAGGAWRWTDFYTFLCAFIRTVRCGGDNLKLFITGLSQRGNQDHSDYVAKIESLLDSNNDLVSTDQFSNKPIIYISDWDFGSEVLEDILPGLDVGLNLNLQTVEGWQSYRVRVLEYLKYCIPVMVTQGDCLAQDYPNSGFIKVKSNNIESYILQLRMLSTGSLSLEDLKERQNNLLQDMNVVNRNRDLVKNLENLSQRSDKKPEHLNPCLFDYTAKHGKFELSNQVESNGMLIVDSFLEIIK